MDRYPDDLFDLWSGVQLDGKTFKSIPLYNLCCEFGNAQVRQACIDLGCRPHIQDLGAIREECVRTENLYV